ncbi:MAG: 4-hydroxy-tetrahydrodipicolinate reductase [Clostridia bacterium]|nr:4-hydroxy-tetrahydrodipicolinate reductase [Clostridia bacterium]
MDELKNKIRVGLSGASGRMCTAIARLARCNQAFEIAFGVDKSESSNCSVYPIYTSFDEAQDCDVVIDFSAPPLTLQALDYAIQRHIPIVVATTGQSEENIAKIQSAGQAVPVFFDSNTSLGNCLLKKLASIAASMLDDSFDVEIVETHHRIKADAPSGTALNLAKAVQTAKQQRFGEEYTICQGHLDKRSNRQIGIHSLRGGTVVGRHEIHFLGNNERLTIVHEVENKSVFAFGALKAAAFLLTKPAGVFCTDDLQNDK